MDVPYLHPIFLHMDSRNLDIPGKIDDQLQKRPRQRRDLFIIPILSPVTLARSIPSTSHLTDPTKPGKILNPLISQHF